MIIQVAGGSFELFSFVISYCLIFIWVHLLTKIKRTRVVIHNWGCKVVMARLVAQSYVDEVILPSPLAKRWTECCYFARRLEKRWQYLDSLTYLFSLSVIPFKYIVCFAVMLHFHWVHLQWHHYLERRFILNSKE